MKPRENDNDLVRYRRTRVYITPFLNIAIAYSIWHKKAGVGGVYEVSPQGPIKYDHERPETQRMCDSAIILRDLTHDELSSESIERLQQEEAFQFVRLSKELTIAELQEIIITPCPKSAGGELGDGIVSLVSNFALFGKALLGHRKELYEQTSKL